MHILYFETKLQKLYALYFEMEGVLFFFRWLHGQVNRSPSWGPWSGPLSTLLSLPNREDNFHTCGRLLLERLVGVDHDVDLLRRRLSSTSSSEALRIAMAVRRTARVYATIVGWQQGDSALLSRLKSQDYGGRPAGGRRHQHQPPDMVKFSVTTASATHSLSPVRPVSTEESKSLVVIFIFLYGSLYKLVEYVLNFCFHH